MRKDNLRQLDMKGRLGATDILGADHAGCRRPPGGDHSRRTMPARFCASPTSTSACRGGDLILQLATGDGPQAGHVILRSFALINEPALRRIIPTQTQIVAGQDKSGKPQIGPRGCERGVSSPRRASNSPARPDGSTSRMRAIWGNQIGFTLGGFIDYARDRLDISGHLRAGLWAQQRVRPGAAVRAAAWAEASMRDCSRSISA